MPWPMNEKVTDDHPDPLFLSSEYAHVPPPGWLFLRVRGVIVLWGARYPRDHGPVEDGPHPVEHYPFSIPVQVIYPNGCVPELSAPFYHHPSDEWVREVARQYVSGERRIIYGASAAWTYQRSQVCQVTIYRSPARKNMVHAARAEEVLTAAHCTVLRMKGRLL